MPAPRLESVKARLENAIALSRLLERVERAGVALHPAQYRALVQQLGEALDAGLPGDALEVVLRAHPAAAEVYENRHYAHAGLSRSPLERSIGSEMLASELIRRVSDPAWTPAGG